MALLTGFCLQLPHLDMLKHPDHEIQFLVEMLEGQRDSAVAQAAALFRQTKELENHIESLRKTIEEQQNAINQVNDAKGAQGEH